MKITFTKGNTPFLVLSLFSLSFSALAVVGTQTARQQVYLQAVTSATADIQRVAKLKNWQNYQSKINVFIPTEVSRFTRCAHPLIVALPNGEQTDLSRLRYDIRCEGGNGWEIAVTVKPDIYLPILVAKTPLERGKLLAASDVEIKKKNITGLRDGYVTTPDEVLGLRIKKRIRDMQPISLSQLDQPVMVERGQRVVMVAEQDGIEAKMIGEAQKKGRKGDLIPVKNLNSQRIVSAMVDNIGVVRILMAPDG